MKVSPGLLHTNEMLVPVEILAGYIVSARRLLHPSMFSVSFMISSCKSVNERTKYRASEDNDAILTFVDFQIETDEITRRDRRSSE